MDYLEHDSPQDTPEARIAAEELLRERGYGAHFVHFLSSQHIAAGRPEGLRTRGYSHNPSIRVNS